METSTAGLIAAGLATCGWLYAARRARTLSRKQHTITVLLQANFNQDFQSHIKTIRAFLIAQNLPANLDDQEDVHLAARRLLNHYEFIAAGLRNGDFDERLVMDSERSAILRLYQACKPYIWSLRTDRNRMSIYEHLEWLHVRWTKEVGIFQRFCEWAMQRPFAGKRHNHNGA
jgi:hypothetical protein